MIVIELPNPFTEPAPPPSLSAENSTVAPSHLDEVVGATVISSAPEVMAPNAPGMARVVIEIPAFLLRNPDNTFRFPTVTSEA